jgi:hypothetical protein
MGRDISLARCWTCLGWRFDGSNDYAVGCLLVWTLRQLSYMYRTILPCESIRLTWQSSVPWLFFSAPPSRPPLGARSPYWRKSWSLMISRKVERPYTDLGSQVRSPHWQSALKCCVSLRPSMPFMSISNLPLLRISSVCLWQGQDMLWYHLGSSSRALTGAEIQGLQDDLQKKVSGLIRCFFSRIHCCLSLYSSSFCSPIAPPIRPGVFVFCVSCSPICGINGIIY